MGSYATAMSAVILNSSGWCLEMCHQWPVGRLLGWVCPSGRPIPGDILWPIQTMLLPVGWAFTPGSMERMTRAPRRHERNVVCSLLREQSARLWSSPRLNKSTTYASSSQPYEFPGEAELVGISGLHAAQPGARQRHLVRGLGELVDLIHRPHTQKGTTMQRIIILSRLAFFASAITIVVVYWHTY